MSVPFCVLFIVVTITTAAVAAAVAATIVQIFCVCVSRSIQIAGPVVLHCTSAHCAYNFRNNNEIDSRLCVNCSFYANACPISCWNSASGICWLCVHNKDHASLCTHTHTPSERWCFLSTSFVLFSVQLSFRLAAYVSTVKRTFSNGFFYLIFHSSSLWNQHWRKHSAISGRFVGESELKMLVCLIMIPHINVFHWLLNYGCPINHLTISIKWEAEFQTDETKIIKWRRITIKWMNETKLCCLRSLLPLSEWCHCRSDRFDFVKFLTGCVCVHNNKPQFFPFHL